jgi:protein-S-isoprenylcysteine O-methyltransferase Ste14
MDTASADNPQLLLSLLVLLSTYLTVLSETPPHPNPPPSGKSIKMPKDRIYLLTSPLLLSIRHIQVWLLGIIHAVFVLYPSLPTSSRLCPHPGNLNPALFTWSPITIISLAIITVFGILRLAAYRGLGKNFTFALAKPNELVTTGVYKWIQHPSYTALFFVSLANFWLKERRDGVFGCWIPESVVRGDGLWGWLLNWVLNLVPCVVVAGATVMFALRVRDEERMMRRAHGKKWEEWHGRTARFIPWVF